MELKEISWKKHGQSYYGKINNTIVASITEAFGNKYEVKVIGIQGSVTNVFSRLSEEAELMKYAEDKFKEMMREFVE